MTNFEKYRDDIIEIIKENLLTIVSNEIGVSNGKPYSCDQLECRSCDFRGGNPCVDQAVNWLLQEVTK